MAKTLVVIVSRNNKNLLEHAIGGHSRYHPGVDSDFIIVDAGSTDASHHSLLKKQRLARVVYAHNDRVEVNFNVGYRSYPGYDYYFFCHDDNVPLTPNWMVDFHKTFDNPVDPQAPDEYKSLPLGRVGALTHFWRDYSSVQGHAVECQFLKRCIETTTLQTPPRMFKYADCDRVLVSRECLEATDGLVTLTRYMKKSEDLYKIFDQFLRYPDEGMYPTSKYPAGSHWNKLTLLSEFMNSIYPLIQGFRTMGINGHCGYLKQIHGEDVPWSHDRIAHYGSPNALQALARHFGADTKQIKSKMSDPAFLIKVNRFFTEHQCKAAA